MRRTYVQLVSGDRFGVGCAVTHYDYLVVECHCSIKHIVTYD
jgi:hypothetical protein